MTSIPRERERERERDSFLMLYIIKNNKTVNN